MTLVLQICSFRLLCSPRLTLRNLLEILLSYLNFFFKYVATGIVHVNCNLGINAEIPQDQGKALSPSPVLFPQVALVPSHSLKIYKQYVWVHIRINLWWMSSHLQSCQLLPQLHNTPR